MKVAVVGSSGYIAKYILHRLSDDQMITEVVKIGRNSKDDNIYLNLEEAEKFNYFCLDQIEYIIFTAAISSPDICAKQYDKCWKVNVIGTTYFIQKAIERGCKVLFFSSDSVYGDIPGKIYDEESITNGITPYGRMKRKIEDTFKNDSNFKAIRLSYVLSAKDRFTTYCLNCIKNDTIAEVFHPFYRNIVSVSDVVDTVAFFIHYWDKYEASFFNVAGKELVSRIRIADEINRIFDNKLKYIICKPEESFFINRPWITQMRSIYLDKFKVFEDNTFTEKIIKELEEISL